MGFVLLVAAFWFAADHFEVSKRIGGGLPTAFVSFGLLLAPYWFFGFGTASALRKVLTSSAARVIAPATLVIPYLLFSLPRGEFAWNFAVAFVAIPVGLAAMFEFLPPQGTGISVQDVVALVVLGVPVEFRLLGGSFPHPGLGSIPKLLLMDAGLYAFLVVRGLERVGYDFRVKLRDVAVGLREWAFFAPFGIVIGLALHFIVPQARWPTFAEAAAAYLVTFFFVAIPEEMFFRGLLQNLLEPRLGRVKALAVTAVIFGLSHFNKPLPFNWRYVLLATIAGVFYGRAWLDRRRLATSGITHATVDVVWSLWFR